MDNSPKPRYERAGNSLQLYHAMQLFDAAWQSVAKGANPPRMEAVLETVSEAERPIYLRELLFIELECRTKRGESPAVADYLQRLPADGETIQAVFTECGIDAHRALSTYEFPDETDRSPGKAPENSSGEAPGAESPSSHQSLKPGTEIGSYTIIRLIGLGGMGAVYEAEHRRMRRKVALKMISASALEHPEALQRFQREAQAMARLEHPNIVTAHDADQVGDINFLVMQYVDGDNLSTMVKNRGALPVDMALGFLVQTARGLEYAHQEGVIHRDIKPSNLIVGSNGVVKILDMGLARLEESLGEVSSVNKNLTQAGNIMGTVDFMAPEQALDAKEADQRADIYSLGCTFYYLLTGQILYEGDTVMKRIMSHRFDPVPSLNDARQDIPEGLDAIFQKMVAKSRADRFRSMTELLAAVAPFVSAGLTGLDVASPTPGHGTLTGDMLLQRPAAWAVKDTGAKPAASIAAIDKTSPSAAFDTQFKNLLGGPSVPATTNSQASQSAERIKVDENVQFTTYCPRQVRPETEYPFLVFAHLADLPDDADENEPHPIEEVERQAGQILREKLSTYRNITHQSRQAVPRAGELTFVLEIEGFCCNPSRQSVIWQNTVHRVEFRIQAHASLNGRTCRGRLSVFFDDILLADVTVRIQVANTPEGVRLPPARTAARPYRKIFASYSRRDLAIVEQLERYAASLGDQYLRDLVDLRSGEQWNEGLKRLIDEADVFQLFWSSNSMRSPIVREEWEYALSLRRPYFIRPTYWEQPFPEAPPHLPPDELRRLHFQLLGRQGVKSDGGNLKSAPESLGQAADVAQPSKGPDRGRSRASLASDTQVKPNTAERPVLATMAPPSQNYGGVGTNTPDFHAEEATVNWRTQRTLGGTGSHRAAGTPSRQRRSRLLGAAALYFGLLIMAISAAVMYLPRDTGTLVIHASKEVKEKLSDKAIKVREAKTGRVHTLRLGSHDLPSGDYEIDAAALPPEVEITPMQKHISLRRGVPVELTIKLGVKDAEPTDAGGDEDH